MQLTNLIPDLKRPQIIYEDGIYTCRYRSKPRKIDTKRRFRSLDDAKAWRDSMIEQHGTILPKGPVRKTIPLKPSVSQLTIKSPVVDWIEAWISHSNSLPIPPAKTTVSSLEHMCSYDFVSTRVEELSYANLASYLRERAQMPSSPGPATLNIDVASLRRVLSSLAVRLNIKYDLSSFDLARKQLRAEGYIGKPKVKDRRLEDGEFKRLLDALAEFRKQEEPRQELEIIIRLFISTGLRLSELFSIKWQDVNFDRKVMHLRILKKRGAEKFDKIDIPMLPETLNLLEKLRPENHSPDDVIYHLKPRTFSKYFSEIAKIAGIEGLSLHDLRTEAISRMFEMGLTIDIVIKFTGHKDREVVERIYKKLKAENVVKNIHKISEFNQMHSDLL